MVASRQGQAGDQAGASRTGPHTGASQAGSRRGLQTEISQAKAPEAGASQATGAGEGPPKNIARPPT